MADIIIRIVIILILIVLSALFSSTETALTTITGTKLRTLVEEGVRNADVLGKVLSDRDKMLSVILICNNIVNLSASALMTVVAQKLFGNVAVSIGTGVLTLLILIFGEIVPKTLATYRAERISLRYCRIIYALMIVLTPLEFVINLIAGGVLRIIGLKKDEAPAAITENELRTIVEVSSEEGVIENEEKELINNVFDFADTIAREVMVPRINVVSIRIDSTYSEVMEIFQENYFTRLPVYDLENEKIIGIVNVKDLVAMDLSEAADFSVRELMREVGYTFEQKHLSELFMEMKEKRCGMMVVLDEYGDTAGIITMEDIIEELIGDIRDEYDEAEEEELVETAENEYLIHGHMSIDDVNDRIGTQLESEDYDSIGGLLMEKLGRIPEKGDSVQLDNITIAAEAVEGTRIELVRVKVGDAGEQ